MAPPRLPQFRYTTRPPQSPTNNESIPKSPTSWVLVKVRRQDIIAGIMQDSDDIVTLRGQPLTNIDLDLGDEAPFGDNEVEGFRNPRRHSPEYRRNPDQVQSHRPCDSDPTTIFKSRPRSQELNDLEKGDGSEKKENVFREEDASIIVDWDGPNDPENPRNWPRSKKWRVTLTLALTTLIVTLASSIYSAGVVEISHEFGISTLVATMGLSLYVWGFAAGPVFWGPGSELYGRRYPIFLGYGLFVVMQIPIAVAQNVQTIMLCRFFAGAFGSAPLAVVAGAFVDIWDSDDLGVAITMFTGATFMGPVLGPVMGSFIAKNPKLDWRWTMWIILILGSTLGLFAFLTVPETYPPTILTTRAKTLRHTTKNWALHSFKEEESIAPSFIFHKYLLKPFTMLIYEPILLLFTLYLSLVYGILYLFLEAYPISFQGRRHWEEGVSSLPFLGIGAGVVGASLQICWYEKRVVRRKKIRNGGVDLPPEEKLVLMIFGAFMLPAGLFWFAWTSNPNIIWVPQVLSGILLGWGILLIFMQGLQYIIEVYEINAASAVSANTIVRCLIAGGFPLFAAAMFDNLGVAWANSLLGFLCVVMTPAPIAFFYFGERLRRMSRFCLVD